MLEVRDLLKKFGNLTAVNGNSFDVAEGEIVGVMGPNGSGKTTTFNLLTGFLKPTSGSVRFRGMDITGQSPDRIAALGMTRTFQITSIFADLTVLGNVEAGHHLALGSPFSLRPRKKIDVRESSLRILETFGLLDLADAPARQLPAGQQRILSVATATAGNPSLLLLDEPLAGLHPTEKAHVAKCISDLRARGITLLLVEHDIKSMMSLCDRLVVLNFGTKIAEGTPAQIRQDPKVIEAYLGEGHADA